MEKLIFMSLPYITPGEDLKEAMELEKGDTVESIRAWASKLAWTAEQLFLLAEKIEDAKILDSELTVVLNADDESIDIECSDEGFRKELLSFDIVDYIDIDPDDSSLGHCDDCGCKLTEDDCDDEFDDENDGERGDEWKSDDGWNDNGYLPPFSNN